MPTALITGANRGIGLGLTRAYATDGWRVIACCRRPGAAEELRALATDVPGLRIEPLDVTDFDAIDALAARVSEPIDLLINNAGVIGPLPIAEHIERQHFGNLDYGVLADVVRVNTYAPIKMAEAFIEHVASSDQKKIVNISSTVGSIGERTLPAVAYSTSKAALNRAMTIVAEAVRERGVIVTLFCPGHVKTRMDAWHSADVEIDESVAGLRRLIAAQTMADTGTFTRYDGSPISW